MFLSKSELEELTGYSRFSAQIRWLKSRGYRYERNAAGRPIVSVLEYKQHAVSGQKTARNDSPDFTFLKELG